MQKSLPLLLICVTLVAGCGGFRDSRLNPLNWFGRSETVTTLAPAPAEDPRALVADVIDMQIDQLPGGAILRATGRAPTQGYWQAELVLREGPDQDPAAQIYDFRIFPPLTPTASGTPQSREVTVAVYLSDIDLAGLQSITVQGAANARAIRR
ncbi:MAG: hypothetical protein MUD11_07515 [Rhodobacteraceae bacterium]|jgi:hypothetical protein|nr:hypothetical protein [Paracoccaceae bacterium]